MSSATDAQPVGSRSAGVLQRLFAPVGGAVLAVLAYVGEFFTLAHRTVNHLLRGEVTRREAFEQMAVVGLGGMPLVAVTVCFSGLVFGVYTVAQFKQFGASDLVGALVGMSMTREVAPVLAATVVAARSGSTIAAEVAVMKITEQVDALRALATDPVEYLGVPRYIALVLMLPALTLIGDITGIWGAGFYASLSGIPWHQYWSSVQDRVTPDYVLGGCIKSMVFGALIAITSLRQGFRCKFGAAAVGRATTMAVVLCILWIHLANLLLASVTE